MNIDILILIQNFKIIMWVIKTPVIFPQVLIRIERIIRRLQNFFVYSDDYVYLYHLQKKYPTLEKD
jgi:hypothetical protein